jgi:hypothetical protein
MSHAGLESSLTGFFAAFLSAAAKADAHWYSVKSLSEGVPSLAALLGISNDNLNLILSLCGFGRIQKDGGLLFQAEKFKNFLAMSDTEAFCEHTAFKPQGFSNKKHFIRVGTVNMSNMSKPGTIGLGPRIRNLRSLQTNFINSIASKSTVFGGGGAVSLQDQSRSNTAAATTTIEEECDPADPTAVGLTLF